MDETFVIVARIARLQVPEVIYVGKITFVEQVADAWLAERHGERHGYEIRATKSPNGNPAYVAVKAGPCDDYIFSAHLYEPDR